MMDVDSYPRVQLNILLGQDGALEQEENLEGGHHHRRHHEHQCYTIPMIKPTMQLIQQIIVILMSRHDDAMTNPLSSDCNPFHESRHCLLHTSLQVPVTS